MGFSLEVDTRAFMRKVEQKVEQGMRDAAKLVESKAKQLVPVDTGALKASIDYELKRVGTSYRASVFATEHYALLIEFGTRNANAQPYLRPALFNNRQDILRKVVGK